MSNSSRIEVATRSHVNQTLTAAEITELVKKANPEWTGGVYPSDAAGKRLEDGAITFRGQTIYGDLVLEYLGPNKFKVLPTKQIVRRPRAAKKAASAPVAKKAKSKKKAPTKASEPPLDAQQPANDNEEAKS